MSGPTNVKRTEGEPHNRLTRLCAAASDALNEHPENSDTLRGAVLLKDGSEYGLVFFGYGEDEQAEAVVDLFTHLRAVFVSNGQELLIVPVGGEISN